MRLIIVIFTLFTHQVTAADTTQIINYHFKTIDTAHHLGEVSITFPQVSTKVLELQLPVWRSGRYEILNLSNAISAFSAHHANGATINWDKTDKNTWKLLLNQPGAVNISYQVYANTLSKRVIHIDNTHAYLDASGVFMFAPQFRDNPLKVNLSVPDNWQSRSGMEKSAQHSFTAKNYDQLVDSPIETGIHEFISFNIEDINYEIVIWGDGNHDINDLKSQVTLLHHEVKNIWGSFPYNRFVYMFHVGDGLRGATEHVNSTIIQQARFNFKPRKSYLKVLQTTAHELVHTWNVKAYRPAGITPYDYSNENYSDLFWMAEGITSYYGPLLLLRAGISQPKEFFEHWAEDIHKHLNNPGRKVESLAQTSFDTWLKEDPQQRHNTSVNIYLEGSLVAWRLDQELRQLTHDKYGIDELQKRLFINYHNSDSGYHKSDVLTLLKDITGVDFNPFWQNYVEGTKAIDFPELLNFYGLQMTPKGDEGESNQAWIGAKLNLDSQWVILETVDTDSPAWRAGLTTGDVILAIDGIQVTKDNIEQRIKQLATDQEYQIHYFNAGKLLTTTLTAIAEPNPAFVIQAVAKPSRQQKARFKAWTGQELKVKP